MTLVYVLNGPNINMLGLREPHLYGLKTMTEIKEEVLAHSERIGVTSDFRQTNHEGELIEWVHEARTSADAIVINGAAYSRTSLALHDAVLAAERPIVEIHITNIYRRAEYRPPSYLSRVCDGVITGFGSFVYRLGLDAALELAEGRGKP